VVGRLQRMVLAAVVAMVAVVGTAASAGAQWPTSCVELNDIVERHLGNVGNVGLYQRVFGEQAEQACQFDHRDDVAATFTWAFAVSDGSAMEEETSTTARPEATGAWPETCVELNDIVEGQLGNDLHVGIYQRVFGEQAETGCRHDHADDVRAVFAWAAPCDVRPNAASADGPTVQELARTEASLQGVLLGLPWLACHVFSWLADGVSANDSNLLAFLQRIASKNRDLAIFTASVDWFADGVVYNYPDIVELNTLAHFENIAERSAALSAVVTTLPWLADQLSFPESIALQSISGIAREDAGLAVAIAAAPWVADGIVPVESAALGAIQYAPDKTASLMTQLLGYTLQSRAWSSDLRLISTLNSLATETYIDRRDGERFDRIVAAPWFADGLDARERAFVTALGMVGWQDHDMFDRLLAGHSTQSLSITLPLAGPFQLWAFQAEPFPAGENVLAELANGLRGAEQIMRKPVPFNDIVILFGRQNQEVYDDGRMILQRLGTGRISRANIYRTVGELYSSEFIGPNYPYISYPNPGWDLYNPQWMAGGAPGFIGEFASDVVGASDLEHTNHRWTQAAYPLCPDRRIASIHAVAVRAEPENYEERRTIESCLELFGQMLLYRLYLILGEERMSAALRELYALPLGLNWTNEEGITIPSERDIFRVFQRHAPHDRQDEMRHWYRHFHGGPFIDDLN